jgi:hypothetical protein
MVTNRYLEYADLPLLKESLEKDEHHKNTPVEFFYELNTVASVYEDEDGIVLFVRGEALLIENYKVLKLDIQFVDNNNARRNMRCMLEGFPILAEKAKQNGFEIVVFFSDVDILKRFCKKHLGFEEAEGIYNWLLKVV